MISGEFTGRNVFRTARYPYAQGPSFGRKGATMAIFAFRTRNPDRDRVSDAQRFQALCGALEELAGQIRREEAGLKNRYEQVRDQAAFAMQNLDNGAAGNLSERADALTRSLAQCEARLAALKTQLDFLARLRGEVDAERALWGG
jgi:chromosome segregation ATPase